MAQPALVLVSGTVHSLGASLYAYALAPALGPRPNVLRVSSDPLSPLVGGYARRLKTGRITAQQSYRLATKFEPEAPAAALDGILDLAESLGSSTILWDLSGPIKSQPKLLLDLAAVARGRTAETALILCVGISQAARRHARLLADAFPGVRVLHNALFGSPDKELGGAVRLSFPVIGRSAVGLLSDAREPFDVIRAKTTLGTADRAAVAHLERVIASHVPYLFSAKESLSV